MARIIPDSWQQVLADLRDDIQQAIRRWLPTRHAHNSDTSTLPAKVEHAVENLRDAFARAIPLPCEVEADTAQAKYSHGVLRITLPKTERAKAARIPVQVT